MTAIFDRAMEAATTTGTGDFTLAGAYTGYRAFSSVCTVGMVVPYCIVRIDVNGNDTDEWEVGTGTYSAANTLTRTTIDASSNAGSAVNFSAGNKRVMLNASAAYLHASSAKRIAFFFTTTPTASEVLLLYTACESITLADDFAGSVGDIGTNPSGPFVLDVQVNGVSVGSITISTGGAFAFATTATTVSLVAGDQLKVVAPATPDATCANVSITLKGAQ